MQLSLFFLLSQGLTDAVIAADMSYFPLMIFFPCRQIGGWEGGPRGVVDGCLAAVVAPVRLSALLSFGNICGYPRQIVAVDLRPSDGGHRGSSQGENGVTGPRTIVEAGLSAPPNAQ